MDKLIFGREAIEQLGNAERKLRLNSLQGILIQKLSQYASEKDFFDGMRELVESLRAIGHDLWSIGYDGETEIWGGDYQKHQISGKLIITFNFNEKAIVEWETG